MNEWKEVTLGSVCDTISKTHKEKYNKVILINTSDVLDGKVLNHEYVENKNLKGQFKKSFEKNDILYSEIRPKNKRFAFVDFYPQHYIASTKLMVLRNKENILPKYLFHLLKADNIINELQCLAETRSGTFPQITFNELSRIKITLPSLPEQKAIADTLSCLDDKIELNNKMNKNLEEMAQAIFTHYIKENTLHILPVSSIVDVRDGTHDSPKVCLTGHPLVTSKHLNPYGAKLSEANLISRKDYEKINERSKVACKDILISMIGTVGVISLVIDDKVEFAIKNIGLFKTSKCEKYTYYLLCYLKSEDALNHIDMCLAGSTQKYISLGELRKFPIPWIEDDKISEFNNTVTPIYEKIIININQNQKLAQIRDTLLPKLMSGKINVKKIKEVVR